MKEGLSGSIFNEIEVNNREKEQRENALNSLAKMKELEKTRKMTYIRENNKTVASDGYFILAAKLASKKKIY